MTTPCSYPLTSGNILTEFGLAYPLTSGACLGIATGVPNAYPLTSGDLLCKTKTTTYNLGASLRTAYDFNDSGSSSGLINNTNTTSTYVAGHNGNAERRTWPSANDNLFQRYLTTAGHQFANGVPFTYSVWFRSSQPFTNTDKDFMSIGRLTISTNGGTTFSDADGLITVIPKANIFNYLSTWQNILVWYDGTTVFFSLNNGISNSGNTAYAAVAMSVVAFFGSSWIGGRGNVVGGGTAFMELDQVFFWDRALNATERGLLWNGGAGRSAAELPTIVG